MKQKLEKHTLRLREGDVDFLRERFPHTATNVVIRRIVSKAVDRLNRPVSENELKELENDE